MSTTTILSHLGGMPVETFLRDYWQKKPLYIPGALTDLPQIDPNELAGFALEDGIESRLITETPTKDPLISQWQVQDGPLDENIFASLPEHHWSLLVQAVDQLDPRLHRLLQRFRFIPGWRLDDIMVSYAPDQGSVGPHFDYYDVFLLQANGKRRWQIGQRCDHTSPLLADCPLKILTRFDSTETFETAPGDLLYVPPQWAHWGVAQGESITYSVGFRAPSHSEVLTDFCLDMASHTNEDQRYGDPELGQRNHSAAIAPQDLARVRAILEQHLSSDEALLEWFGSFMTEPRRLPPTFEIDHADLKLQPNCLYLNPGVRVAFYGDESPVTLFVWGRTYSSSGRLAKALGNREPIAPEQYDARDQKVIEQLIEMGAFWEA